jgi:hypothetical protein
MEDLSKISVESSKAKRLSSSTSAARMEMVRTTQKQSIDHIGN